MTRLRNQHESDATTGYPTKYFHVGYAAEVYLIYHLIHEGA